jgi:glycine cleavage system H protein
VEFPQDLRYTSNDEWIRLDGDEGTVGVTDYAQDQLGDVVYVELPAIGTRFAAGDACGIIESVKAVADLYVPVSGEVIARNDALEESPELVNESPYGEGWIIRLRVSDPAELEGLMSAEDYQAQLPDEPAE